MRACGAARRGPAAAIAAALALAGAGQHAPAGAQSVMRPAVLLVGDSTMAAGNGYGQALCARLEPAIECLNFARNGRSSGSFRTEGHWGPVRDTARQRAAHRPVWVLVQFGHNDQPGKPGRSTDLDTEFPANLAHYVADGQLQGARVVLVTPLTRRSFRQGELVDDLGPWAERVREVARRLAVDLIDLNRSSRRLVQGLGADGADGLALAPPGQPGYDRTHLGPRGACVFADLVLQDLLPLLQQQASAVVPPLWPPVDCRQADAAAAAKGSASGAGAAK